MGDAMFGDELSIDSMDMGATTSTTAAAGGGDGWRRRWDEGDRVLF